MAFGIATAVFCTLLHNIHSIMLLRKNLETKTILNTLSTVRDGLQTKIVDPILISLNIVFSL